MKLKKIKIAIDSPAASGAGTISKMLSKKYNLFYCDTGKIYRFFAFKLMKKNIKNKIKYLSQISKKIDSASATWILQSALDTMKNKNYNEK